MAKKARTPAPPRRVQAPQRRDGTRGKPPPAVRRPLWMIAAAVGALVVAGIVAGVLLTRGGSTSSGKTPSAIDWATMPGVRTTKPPWDAGLDTIQERLPQLEALGLPALAAEGLKRHWHQHLDIYWNGKHYVAPTGVGIFGNQFIMALHVHDASGIVHLESPTLSNYTLGEFFAVWGVRLTPSAIGAACGKVAWYIDGKKQLGNPESLVLKEHQEIALVCGKPPAKIPTTFDFKKLGL